MHNTKLTRLLCIAFNMAAISPNTYNVFNTDRQLQINIEKQYLMC